MDFFITTRGRKGDGYGDKPGSTRYLSVPSDSQTISRSHEMGPKAWFAKVTEAAERADGTGDVALFIHGYNTAQHEMRDRHNKIVQGLRAQGFDGVVVGFDWPSNGDTIDYLSDRRDARRVADDLVCDGIAAFARWQRPDCQITTHVLAHSMGCYLLREAFDYADEHRVVAQHNWTVGQVALVAADISSDSIGIDSDDCRSLLRHAVRLTNYYNPFDSALTISNIKRAGVRRRLGRVGAPEAVSDKVVNLYCGDFFKRNEDDLAARDPDSKSLGHTWYFSSERFYEDLMHTLRGELDRDVIPTRGRTSRGNLALS